MRPARSGWRWPGSLGPIARASGAEHGPAKPGPGFDGYGPLRPDPAGRLSLPKGFHYRVVAESGVTRLETGELEPGLLRRHGQLRPARR